MTTTSHKLAAALGMSAITAGLLLAAPPANASGLGWAADQWQTKTLVDFNFDRKPDTVKDTGDKAVKVTDTEITCKVEFKISDGYSHFREYTLQHSAAAEGLKPEQVRCPSVHAAGSVPEGYAKGAIIRAHRALKLPGGADYAVLDFKGKLHPGGKAKWLKTANNYDFMDLNQDGISDLIVKELDPKSWGRIGIMGKDGNVKKWQVVQNGVYGVADFDPTVRGVEVLVHQTDPVPGVKCINKGNCIALFSPHTWTYRAVPNVAKFLKGSRHITRGYHKDVNGDGLADIQVRLNGGSDKVVSFLNDGRGNFALPPKTKPTGPAPVANRDYVVMYEKYGVTAAIDVLANDKFTGPVKISFNTLKPGEGQSTWRGQFTVTKDNKIHYKRHDTRPGLDLTYYTITDQWGRKHQSKLVVNWQNVKSPAPIARNDRVRMYPGTFDVAGINVLRNDKNTSRVSVGIVKYPKVGRVEVMKNGRIRYDRKGKPVKNDVFYYKITDTQGRSSVARVAIDVE